MKLYYREAVLLHGNAPWAEGFDVTGYVLRRVLSVIPVLFGLSVVVFLLIRGIPGDPVAAMLGEQITNLSEEDIASLREVYGIDVPVFQQYVRWAGAILVGDFGKSTRSARPVLEEIRLRLAVSFQVMLGAMFVALVLGIPAGVVAAVRQRTWLDSVVRVLGLLSLSIPNFWLATLLILFTSLFFRPLYSLGWTPLSHDIGESLRATLLPAIALGTARVAIIMRMTRSSVLEVLRQDFVRTAVSKGLLYRVVVLKHALRPALIPVITVAGIQVGALMGGAVIVEYIFALPGIGSYVVNAVYQRDYPVIQGVLLFIAAMFVAINLLADLLYVWADPRIRFSP